MLRQYRLRCRNAPRRQNRAQFIWIYNQRWTIRKFTTWVDIAISSQKAQILRSATVAIWESTMINRQNFEAADIMQKRLRSRPSIPLDGLLFIGAGDFWQIPPVVENESQEAIIAADVKSLPLWPRFSGNVLHIPVRQLADLHHPM